MTYQQGFDSPAGNKTKARRKRKFDGVGPNVRFAPSKRTVCPKQSKGLPQANYGYSKMKQRKQLILVNVLLAAGLLAGCAGSDGEEAQQGEAPQTISVRADIWRIMEATRAATTYGSAAELQTEGSFNCSAYHANTTTAYFSNATVNWNNTDTEWLFADGKHYWPATGSLDFFAYLPATPPAYITTVDYSTARTPVLTCTNLPVTPATQSSSLKEFVYALTTDQSKAGQGASGVTLTFPHPFARIYLQEGTIPSTVTLNSITLSSIKNNGTYTHGTGWTPSGDNTNFSATTFGGPYLVVPQAFGGTVEVSATWDEWGVSTLHNLVASVPTTWQPGYSYTYTISISGTDLKVDIEKFTEQW